MKLTEIKRLIPDCCAVATVDIDKCSSEEKESLEEYLPSVRSIIVLGHHIRRSVEWVWTTIDSESEESTCIADLHTKDISKKIDDYIGEKGYRSKIIPYPGASGVLFKSLASKTSLGEIGDNFLFLHHKWGPWVHLRVLATTAKLSSNQEESRAEICIHCGKCIAACPEDAINKNGFNSHNCRKRQEELNTSHSCEVCARVCPIGTPPK
ncbi:4Fe-4S dicluster domain-containing protein [Halanaerobaculum tunisiense]